MYAYTNKQAGVASIFIVVFFMLLISIIVLGFAQIVSQDQRQSINSDLSSSAYDSAQAGVEDAKRALALYKKECIETNKQAADECVNKYSSTTEGAFSGKDCTTFQSKVGSDLKLNTSSTEEVKVTTDQDGGNNDSNLDQAYTCLKVKLQTTDYKRSLDNGSTIIVPLKTVSGMPTSIQFNWFDKNQADQPDLPTDTNFTLPRTTSTWGANKPPVMRVQVIAVPKENINIDEINQFSRAVFLYPTTNGSETVSVLSQDLASRSPKNSPVGAKCKTDSASYACNVRLTNLVAGSYDYYLRITPIYNGASLQIQMFDSSNTRLKFDGVEPEVDSTGRANDVFRRVVSRIAFDSDTSGIDVTQGICKNFSLADFDEYYSAGCSND